MIGLKGEGELFLYIGYGDVVEIVGFCIMVEVGVVLCEFILKEECDV